LFCAVGLAASALNVGCDVPDGLGVDEDIFNQQIITFGREVTEFSFSVAALTSRVKDKVLVAAVERVWVAWWAREGSTWGRFCCFASWLVACFSGLASAICAVELALER